MNKKQRKRFFRYFAKYFMSIFNKQILVLIIGTLGSIFSYSQSTVSLELMTFGVHPFEKPNLKLYENAIDANGNVCTEPGLNLSYEFFVSENRVSFQFTQSIFADAAGQMAGITEFSFRRLFFHKWRSSMYLEIGAALTYRNSWSKLSHGNIVYIPETKYYKNGNWEVLPSVIGKYEYDFYIGNKSDIIFGILYGHSYKTFTATLGYRYWLSTKVKHSKGCDCKNKYKKKFKDLFK